MRSLHDFPFGVVIHNKYTTILEYSTDGRCSQKIIPAFVLYIFNDEENAAATLQAICVRYNGRIIPTIIHLEDSFDSFGDYDPLWHFLKDHSSHIETLVLDAGLWMLTYGPRSDGDDDPAKYTSILPSLKHLIVIGASFHERGLLEYQRLLRARTVSGTRIETLTLHCQTQSDAEGWEVLKADVCLK
ncbi:hypothetical protein ONZ45_g13641 [Pleurotus djamor]|nr:hypothetical protein ONZ45_g13641 [Pleurotus djamor]